MEKTKRIRPPTEANAAITFIINVIQSYKKNARWMYFNSYTEIIHLKSKYQKASWKVMEKIANQLKSFPQRFIFKLYW